LIVNQKKMYKFAVNKHKSSIKMKKLFFIFGIVGLITLTSCGAQESCRSRASYVSHEQIQNTNLVSVDIYTDIK